MELKPSHPFLAPTSAMETIAEATQVLGPQVTQWAVQLAARIDEDITATADRDPTLRLTHSERPACEASLLSVLAFLVPGGRPLRKAPDEAVEHVRLAVRQGAPVGTVLRVVWMSHTAVQDALLDALETSASSESPLTEVRRLSSSLLHFVDLLTRELSSSYEEERTAWLNKLSISRRQVLEDILATAHAPDGAEDILGMRLARRHVAAVLWVCGPVGQTETAGPAHSYAHQVAADTEAAGFLLLDGADGTSTALWSYRTTEGDPVPRIRDIASPDGLSVAVGPAGTDVAGLRTSVLGARQMLRFGRSVGGVGRWFYDDTALASLAAVAGEETRRFVARVLAGLTGRDSRSAAIRETLRSYLEHGGSRQAAAQELSLAPNTVAYRVRQAEQRLGRPAAERATDTVAALLLARECPWSLEPEILRPSAL
ncbi:PucR family transcriptional regulator [Streptomyces sp. NPDC003247]|uniref:PucR family transcriptional regulator n=1 Tax=Streptomyces sp. NPDC003247 TaxID=3364677 RepID=UPI0036866B70